ncbi:hypothetical protein AB0Q95_00145 [Streptomyces sp. NPDC059900]|uniref:hypothetical protein n=1 Tax=Streptomyces sp. NPDC059900 TaxID=3155816 RepID=UPI00341F060D
MFEIRIICPSGDAALITRALSEAFVIGPVLEREAPSADKVRLSMTADHRSEVDPWPTPEQAYADAPSIVREIGWVSRNARTVATGEHRLTETEFAELEREYYLRKAAVLDRISLQDDPAIPSTGAAEVADAAALYLMDRDGAGHIDPRHYVRREYAAWAKNQ